MKLFKFFNIFQIIQQGQDGLVKIERGKNICCIEKYPRTVVVKPKAETQIKPIASPTVCSSFEDIYIEKEETYLKSLGLIKYSQTYENSRINCLKYGMQLFKLDSNDASSAVFNFSSRFWTFPGSRLFVNGVKLEGCAVLSNVNGTFKATTENCTEKLNSFCEFINNERK